MIQQHQAVGNPQRVVVGERDDPGPQSDPLGPLRGSGNEDLRRADDLTAGRVVLAEPDFVEAQRIEVFDELEISLQCQGRVGTRAVKRCDEIPKPELGHWRSPTSRVVRTLNPVGSPRPPKPTFVPESRDWLVDNGQSSLAAATDAGKFRSAWITGHGSTERSSPPCTRGRRRWDARHRGRSSRAGQQTNPR